MADYIYFVQMDIPEEHEAEFNRVYDEEHIPAILKVKGAHACRRYKLEKTNKDGMARYAAIYEVDSPDIPECPEWQEAAAVGVWIEKIRPHTKNRSHTIFKQI
jgi:hypothetical protein